MRYMIVFHDYADDYVYETMFPLCEQRWINGTDNKQLQPYKEHRKKSLEKFCDYISALPVNKLPETQPRSHMSRREWEIIHQIIIGSEVLQILVSELDALVRCMLHSIIPHTWPTQWIKMHSYPIHNRILPRPTQSSRLFNHKMLQTWKQQSTTHWRVPNKTLYSPPTKQNTWIQRVLAI